MTLSSMSLAPEYGYTSNKCKATSALRLKSWGDYAQQDAQHKLSSLSRLNSCLLFTVYTPFSKLINFVIRTTEYSTSIKIKQLRTYLVGLNCHVYSLCTRTMDNGHFMHVYCVGEAWRLSNPLVHILLWSFNPQIHQID